MFVGDFTCILETLYSLLTSFGLDSCNLQYAIVCSFLSKHLSSFQPCRFEVSNTYYIHKILEINYWSSELFHCSAYTLFDLTAEIYLIILLSVSAS